MKKILFAMLASIMVFAACQKTENSLPTVSFATAIPVMSDGSAVFTLEVSNYTSTSPVTVPVTFETDAEEGVDYEVSASEFVYGGSNPVTVITVTPLKYGTGKVVNATLSIPDGFAAGKYTTSSFTLSERIGYLSFSSKTGLMTETATVSVNVYDGNGNSKVLESGDAISVSVNTEKSTAVEGTNFKFAGKKEIVIDSGKSTGSATLEIIGEPEEGKDLIVLDLDLGEKYNAGQTIQMEITILGSAFSKAGGKWVINELITDAEYMRSMWVYEDSEYEKQLGKFPEFNAEDSFEIDLETGIFTPSFKSGFKNYFIGVSNIQKDKEITLRGMGTSEQLQMLKFDNINRYFSDSQTSEEKTALVAIRMITDEESGEELLDMYIIDYNPTDFLSILYDYYCLYPDNRPTAVTEPGSDMLMGGSYLNLTFKRAE